MLRLGSISFILLVLLSCSKTQQITTNGAHVEIDAGNVALMWLAPDCPLCQSYSGQFVQLANTNKDGMRFYGVLPGKNYSSEEIIFFADSFNFDVEIIADTDFALTKQFNTTVTPEFLVLKEGEVFYQGKFDDWATDLSRKKLKPSQHFFKDAVSASVNGKDLATKYTTPIGCIIEFD